MLFMMQLAMTFCSMDHRLNGVDLVLQLPEQRLRDRTHRIKSRSDANQPHVNYVDVGLVIILVKE
jgi:hypothetical protein